MDEESLQKYMAQPLSDDDVKVLAPGVPCTLYKDLEGKTLREVTDGAGRGLVLLVEDETANAIVGHWVALCRQPNGLLVFDPYGGREDPWYEMSTFVSNRERQALDQTRPLLRDLARRSGNLRMLFNTTEYQKEAPGINTCGRHCIVRLWQQRMNNAQYKEWMGAQGTSPDVAVTIFTQRQLDKRRNGGGGVGAPTMTNGVVYASSMAPIPTRITSSFEDMLM